MPRQNITTYRVAEVILGVALLSDVVDVKTSLLEGGDHSRVTVNGTWDASEGTLVVVAGVDQVTAEGVFARHLVTLFLLKNGTVYNLQIRH
jgi:hypothetical protein